MAKKDGDDKKQNPLAKKLFASMAKQTPPPPAAAEGAKAAAPSKGAPPAKGAAKEARSGDMLDSLVSALKSAAPGFGQEEKRAKKPEGYEHLKAARGGKGIGPGAMAAQSKAVQAAMIAAGIPVEETGVYDEATEDAVRRFQREQGLDRRSGVFDGPTLDALDKHLGIGGTGRVNIASVGPTGADDPTGSSDEGGVWAGTGPASEKGGGGGGGGSKRVNVEAHPDAGGGLFSNDYGVGVNIGGFVGAGHFKGKKGPASSYTAPSDEDREEEASFDAARGKSKDGRPASFPRAENAFIDRIAWTAVRAMWETGIPASALIAIAVLEGAWGDRPLARDGKNLFGLEGEGPAGSLPMTLGEAGYAGSMSEAGDVAGGGRGKGARLTWRRYASWDDGIMDMARTMAEEVKYAPAVAAKGAPERMLRALGDVHKRIPHFGETCVRVYQQHGLGQYDRVTP